MLAGSLPPVTEILIGARFPKIGSESADVSPLIVVCRTPEGKWTVATPLFITIEVASSHSTLSMSIVGAASSA